MCFATRLKEEIIWFWLKFLNKSHKLFSRITQNYHSIGAGFSPLFSFNRKKGLAKIYFTVGHILILLMLVVAKAQIKF
jgi:hypothetical protein